MKLLLKQTFVAVLLCLPTQVAFGQGLPPTFLNAFAGPINVHTSVKRETDKKGMLLGAALNVRWRLADAYVSTGFGYLAGQAEGKSDFTVGDQTAKLVSPLIEFASGYHVTSLFSAALGVQAWLGEGSNFAPESEAKKNTLYYYVDFNVDPAMSQPIAFNVRYTKDLNVNDRDISIITVGTQYQLPL